MTQKMRLGCVAVCLLVLGLNACAMPTNVALVTPTESLATATTTSADPQPSPSPTILQTPTEASAPAPESTPAPSPTALPGYPESHYIAISGHGQAYPLSCEAAAAVDWAAYFGVDFCEYDFQMALPLSDNPDYGFCGDVFYDKWGQIPPYAYGVHAGPVADLLVKYGLPARAISGWTLEQVKQKLAEDKPIMVWVIGNMEYSTAVIYTDTEGRSVRVAAFEHSVILTGYDATTIRYMNNGRFFDVPAEVFLTSWGVLNNMGIVYE